MKQEKGMLDFETFSNPKETIRAQQECKVDLLHLSKYLHHRRLLHSLRVGRSVIQKKKTCTKQGVKVKSSKSAIQPMCETRLNKGCIN